MDAGVFQQDGAVVDPVLQLSVRRYNDEKIIHLGLSQMFSQCLVKILGHSLLWHIISWKKFSSYLPHCTVCRIGCSVCTQQSQWHQFYPTLVESHILWHRNMATNCIQTPSKYCFIILPNCLRDLYYSDIINNSLEMVQSTIIISCPNWGQWCTKSSHTAKTCLKTWLMAHWHDNWILSLKLYMWTHIFCKSCFFFISTSTVWYLLQQDLQCNPIPDFSSDAGD